MGSCIAAQFASRGVRVHFLDLTVQLAREGLARSQAGPLATPGSFEGDLPMLSECDWVIEAVAENLEIKRSLWERAARFLSALAIASTNTSGLSIASIAEVLPLHLRQHFLGVHFF